MAVIRNDIVTPASVSNEYSPGAKGFIEKVRSLVTGLGITARISTEKPITIRYPAEKWDVSPRWRGALRLRGVLGHDEIPLIRDASTAYNAVIEDLYTGERLPPCVGNCPANVDARGQGFLIAEDRIPEAYELVRDRNILPGVLGRICHHPCETACRRNFYDEPVAIRPLHRFAYEEFRKVASERLRPLPITEEKSVAIVGSGPSGLAAAYDLMQAGYRCRHVRARGASRWRSQQRCAGVPAARATFSTMRSTASSHSASSCTAASRWGRTSSSGSFSASTTPSCWPSGCRQAASCRFPATRPTVSLARSSSCGLANHKGETGVRGKQVFVIGGGNVAVDVARCALRDGATEVRLASLESEDEMPAHPWEIEEALDEGVIATCSVGPEEVLVKGGAVVGMRMRECLSVFDETGRFSPKFGEGLSDFPCDVVVFSIGQAAKLDALISGTEVLVSGRGQLVVDGSQFTTSTPGVFACGEVVTGPGSAIGSIATGHEAATSIIRYLRGTSLTDDRHATSGSRVRQVRGRRRGGR